MDVKIVLMGAARNAERISVVCFFVLSIFNGFLIAQTIQHVASNGRMGVNWGEFDSKCL